MPDPVPVDSWQRVVRQAADVEWQRKTEDINRLAAATYREAAAALHSLLASEPSYETRVAVMLGVLTLEARADALDGGEGVSVEVGDGVLDEAEDSIEDRP